MGKTTIVAVKKELERGTNGKKVPMSELTDLSKEERAELVEWYKTEHGEA